MKSQPEVNAFIERYVALWNETDDAARHRMMSTLWAKNADDYVASRQTRYHGLDEIEARVQRANVQYVQEEGFSFRSRQNAAHTHDAIRFHWEMIKPNGEVATIGLDLLILDADDRIERAYQFTET